MPTRAFRMRLDSGQAAEYRARHDAIWPELVSLLHEAGISDYSIFLDPETHHLFAIFRHQEEARLATLPAAPLMRRWWAHMADIMATNEDGSPVVTLLERVFHMA